MSPDALRHKSSPKDDRLNEAHATPKNACLSFALISRNVKLTIKLLIGR